MGVVFHAWQIAWLYGNLLFSQIISFRQVNRARMITLTLVAKYKTVLISTFGRRWKMRVAYILATWAVYTITNG